jgi:hypothetical protein
VHTFPYIYMRPIVIASSVLHLGFPIGLFPWGFHTNTVYTFSSSTYLIQNVTHISTKFFVPWKIKQPQNSNKQPGWFQVSFIIMTKFRRCNNPRHNNSQCPNNICKNSIYEM